MSYLTFHLVFILPPILVLAVTQPRPLAGLGTRRARWSLPLVSLIAFLYTTPWDNYLVYRAVWNYGPERVMATVGYVPVEEYAFFLLQPVLTGLVLYQLLGRRPPSHSTPSHSTPSHSTPSHSTPSHSGTRAHGVGAGFFLALGVAGALLLMSGWERGLYLGLILAWTGPVIAGLWLWIGALAWQHKRLFLAALFLPSIYLWCIDAVALRLGIWSIADATSLGIGVAGLPFEEALFFLMTNAMVVLGLLLFLYPERTAF